MVFSHVFILKNVVHLVSICNIDEKMSEKLPEPRISISNSHEKYIIIFGDGNWINLCIFFSWHQKIYFFCSTMDVAIISCLHHGLGKNVSKTLCVAIGLKNAYSLSNKQAEAELQCSALNLTLTWPDPGRGGVFIFVKDFVYSGSPQFVCKVSTFYNYVWVWSKSLCGGCWWWW